MLKIREIMKLASDDQDGKKYYEMNFPIFKPEVSQHCEKEKSNDYGE